MRMKRSPNDQRAARHSGRPSSDAAPSPRPGRRRHAKLAVALAAFFTTAVAVALIVLGGGASSDTRSVMATLLVVAVAFFYLRSVAASAAVERMAREKEALLGITLDEARTDQLTNLGNRRALARDLAARSPIRPAATSCCWRFSTWTASSSTTTPTATRRATRCSHASPPASPPRPTATPAAPTAWAATSSASLRARAPTPPRRCSAPRRRAQEAGEGWHVGCSHGAAWIPSEAATVSEALQARRRAHVRAARRAAHRPAGRSTDALLQVISEQNVFLDEHVERVAALAGRSPRRSACPSTRRTGSASPRGCTTSARRRSRTRSSTSPARSTSDEWEFMRRHTADRRAHRARRAGAGADRAADPLEPRALRRRRLPRRARGRARSRSARGSSPSATPTTR